MSLLFLFLLKERYCLSILLIKKEQKRVSFLCSFSLNWKQRKKNKGFQQEDRHFSLNGLVEKVSECPGIFLFLESVKRLLLVLEILAYVCNVIFYFIKPIHTGYTLLKVGLLS